MPWKAATWAGDDRMKSFSEMLKGMSAGQVVGPIRGPSGFQLLKLVETRDASQSEAEQYRIPRPPHPGARYPGAGRCHGKAKIDTLRARIAGGAGFVEVLKESSEDTNSKADGGDLGWFEGNAFGPAFGKEVTGTSDGQISRPFRTEAGWHIVQRVGERQTDVTNSTPACPGA